MAAIVYVLCSLTSAACAVLLLRGYAQNRLRLLLWSGLCFAGLAINNALLFFDREVITDTSLGILRAISGLAALLFLLYGLVWESE